MIPSPLDSFLLSAPVSPHPLTPFSVVVDDFALDVVNNDDFVVVVVEVVDFSVAVVMFLPLMLLLETDPI